MSVFSLLKSVLAGGRDGTRVRRNAVGEKRFASRKYRQLVPLPSCGAGNPTPPAECDPQDRMTRTLGKVRSGDRKPVRSL